MANVKISEMDAATLPLAGTEELEVVQGGESRRAPASAFGGGGDYTVLNIDFTATEAASNVSSPVVLSTFSMPANSLGPTQQLLLESYVSYVQEGTDIASDFTTMQLSHRVGGVNIGVMAIPVSKGSGAAPFTGMLKLESRIQALNSANLQYNEARYYEFRANESSGILGSTGMHMDGTLDPFINNTTSIDMTAVQDVQLRVTVDGLGLADSKLVHRFTRVSVIG
jgi:hypothetical protein